MNSDLQARETTEGHTTEGHATEGHATEGYAADGNAADGAGLSAAGAGAVDAGGDAAAASRGSSFEAGEAPVNYEEAALLELEIEGVDYRFDVGRAGTALCISTRMSGSWSWVFRGEARWQNGVLRCKAFDRHVLSQLSTALAEAAGDTQS